MCVFVVGLVLILSIQVLRLRDPKNHPRSRDWDVMVDLFFYRDPEEERVAEELGGEQAEGADGEWGGAAPEPGNWEDQNWGGSAPGGGEDWAGGAGAGEAGWDSQGLQVPVSGWDNEAAGDY